MEYQQYLMNILQNMEKALSIFSHRLFRYEYVGKINKNPVFIMFKNKYLLIRGNT